MFVYYTNARVKPVKKYPRAWIAPAQSFEGSMKYCRKSETRIAGPFKKGEEPAQGKRTDLELIAKKIMAGTPIEQIAMEEGEMFVKYHGGMKAMANIVTKHRTTKPTIIWLHGLAGTGKTSYVFDKHGFENVYVKDGTAWWDGYCGQTAIVIDDFDGKWPYRDLLRLLDRYPYQGQVKGSVVKINSPFIYITCEFQPEHFYENEVPDVNCYGVKAVIDPNKSKNHLDQILGRIDHIWEKKGCEYGLRKPPERGLCPE